MIPDVERNGFTFTDGVGTISRELMQLVHDKVNYNNTQKLEFSAVQIRVNGCKGVLSMDPTLTGRRICIRPSMQKFTTDHYQLEIVTPARVNACHLNRQAITLLSTLGVPDESFQALHDKMLNELNGMVLDDKSALQVLSKTNMHMNDCLRIMINSGIHVQSDPFLYNMLWVTRVKMLKDLRTKTRILVENGAVLMGVSDESRRLRNNQVYIKTSKHGVISGQVVIVKNPCTHPGDVRVVNAVTLDRLQCCMDDDGNELENTFLEEIKDVIVFTQYGARPVPNEASGSDLDGDEYHVFWDPSIKPATVEPASYIALEELHEPINFDTLTRFFVNFLLNDQLGRIANAWLCHADASDQGANDDACLFLAQQHSNAVDYAKSGRPAYFPKRLKTKSVPDFTENKHKDSYLSDKIIGKLFRQITENKDPDPITEFDVIHEFDLEGVENYLQEAKELRDDYNFSLTSMMKIFGVKNEFEFVSGNVTTFGKDLSSHKEYDVRERIINAYSALRKEFLQKFEMGLDGALEEEREKKACAWYKVVYKGEYSKYEKKLYSFAWLRYGELTNIKKRSRNL
ncbi:RNAi component RdRP [Acrasis kona]|uniref:RNA-dependent RNA polymerase n=1 Tax=Acrasis kona TaxID=1008807 RepID=A0AAW2YTF4_9EUKA